MRKLALFLALLAGVASSLLLWWSWYPPLILVGVDAPLTPGSVFDPTEMNAADLFLEEHPHSRIALFKMYRDFTPQRAVSDFQDAMRQGVRFFITSHPSSCAVVSLPLFSDAQALRIETGATSPVLTGKDDFVLRLIPDAVQEQRALAGHVNQMPGQRLLVLQDLGNPAYTEPAFAIFAAELAAAGRWHIVRRTLMVADFKPEDYRALMAESYDALYILAGTFQPAIGNIAQLFHHLHPGAPILLTPWARSRAILEIAGAAIDRIILPSQYPSRYQDPALNDFFRRFRARFGYEPHAIAFEVRKALELLDQAFALGYDTPEKVKQYLLATPAHQTSLGPIVFDRYGDVTRNFFFIQDLKKELK